GWNTLHVERLKKNLTRKKEDTLKRFYENMFTKDELKENKRFEDMIKRFKGDSIQSLQLGLEYLIEADMREELKEINVPILLIHGEQDVICPWSAARSMAENETATLKIVSEAGHALCVTNFEYCGNEIIQFVEGIRHDQQNVT
nr:alpha/beta hydrolase [Bacillus paranthracis]